MPAPDPLSPRRAPPLVRLLLPVAHLYADKQDLKAGRYADLIARAERRLRIGAWSWMLMVGMLAWRFMPWGGQASALSYFDAALGAVLLVVVGGMAYLWGRTRERLAVSRDLLAEGETGAAGIAPPDAQYEALPHHTSPR